jgi:hypothetical protein
MMWTGYDERVVRNLVDTLSEIAKDEIKEQIKKRLSSYLKLYKKVYGFETYRISKGPNGISLSAILTESYSPNNHLVKAFKKLLPIDEYVYPSDLNAYVICSKESKEPAEGVKVNELTAPSTLVTVYNGVEEMDDEEMGRLTCKKIVDIIFTGRVNLNNVGAADLFKAAVEAMRSARDDLDDLRKGYVKAYGIEPAAIQTTTRLGETETLLATLIGLDMLGRVREYVIAALYHDVPYKNPDSITLGMNCGPVSGYVYTVYNYQVIIGRPYLVGVTPCIKHVVIWYGDWCRSCSNDRASRLNAHT